MAKYTVIPAGAQTTAAAIRVLLASSSNTVKGVYRDTSKAPEEFTSKSNFTAVKGDIGDASSLDFSDTDGIIYITPPNYQSDDIVGAARTTATNVKGAIEKAGTVKKVVFLSSVGAEHATGVGAIKSNNAVETVFRDLNVPEVVYLRAAYFMENWSSSAATLQGPEPFIFSTITPLDYKVPMVAVSDIGSELANQLTSSSSGTKPLIVDLQGPDQYTAEEVRAAFAKELGKDVGIKAIEGKDNLENFLKQVFPPAVAVQFAEMTTSFLPGGLIEGSVAKLDQSKVVHGKTPLSEVIKSIVASV